MASQGLNPNTSIIGCHRLSPGFGVYNQIYHRQIALGNAANYQICHTNAFFEAIKYNRFSLGTILEMEHADIEFLAEKQPVKIVPNFSLEKIYFISGDFGPFQPGLPLEVPLWLAISLKQQQKCRIHPPEWLNTEDLEAKKEEENTSDIFTELPSPHFREVANLLLTHATDNVQNADEIRTLVKDIWDIRAAKLRSNVDKFVKLQAGHARLDNLTQMEINTIRPFLTGSLDHLHKLRMSQTIAERNIPSQ